jgi:ATP-dependent protease HslVU (ClpYQ) peptidase subunit
VTTLIAFQHEDWCLIAADTQTTGYDIGADCSPMGKIARNGKYLVSAAGLVRGMNLIQHAFNPPAPPRTNVKPETLDKFVISSFVPSLRKTFMQAGYDVKQDGQAASFENDFIIAANGTLYFIDEGYGVERTKTKLYCTGTGMKLALGAADALGINDVDNYEDAIDILEKAVRTAIKYDVYSSGKIQMALQTKNNETFIEFLD